jgi:hypothetical protein
LIQMFVLGNAILPIKYMTPIELIKTVYPVTLGGNVANDLSLLKERLNLRTVLCSFIVGAFGFFLLYLSRPIDDSGYHRTSSLFREGGAVLVATVAIALLWDWVGKRAFADEILAKTNMSRDLSEAGIEIVSSSFQDKRIVWEELFKNACKLDLFISYGHTWRNSQIERIDKLLSDPDARIRVVFPDPDDADVVTALSTRYGLASDDLKKAILDAKSFFEYRKSRAKGSVEIYFTQIVPLLSLYHFNNKVVFALYNHREGRQPVPTFVVDRDGFLFEYFTREIEAIIGDAARTKRVDIGASANDRNEK